MGGNFLPSRPHKWCSETLWSAQHVGGAALHLPYILSVVFPSIVGALLKNNTVGRFPQNTIERGRNSGLGEICEVKCLFRGKKETQLDNLIILGKRVGTFQELACGDSYRENMQHGGKEWPLQVE